MNILPKVNSMNALSSNKLIANRSDTNKRASHKLVEQLTLYEKKPEQPLSKIQESLAKLDELKDNLSPKKQAIQRAAMLKQRLEMLKNTLEKLPPGNYKVLVQELKQIAKQLASLSKQLGNSAATPANLTANLRINTGEEASAEANLSLPENLDAAPEASLANLGELTTAEAKQLEAEAKQLAAEAAANLPEEITKEVTGVEKAANESEKPENKSQFETEAESLNISKPVIAYQSAAASTDDQDKQRLQKILGEAGGLLKYLANLLKAKQVEDDEELDEEHKKLNKHLAELDKNLSNTNFAHSSLTSDLGSFLNLQV